MFPGGPTEMASCIRGVIVLEGSEFLCTSQYVPTTNYKQFSRLN